MTSIQVQLKLPNQNPVSGEIEIETYSKGQRITRTLVRAAVGLVFTSLLVAIPLLHFVLVPIGLLATIGITASAYKQTGVVVSGAGKCPACGSEIKFVKRPLNFPFTERCDNCLRESSITPLV